MREPSSQATSPETPGKPSRAINEQRRMLIEQARQRWSDRLIDLSRRNSLLYFRPSQSTLELSPKTSPELHTLFDDQPVRLSKLVANLEEAKADSRARTIRRRAILNLEEKGVQTLFLAVGMATWEASDGGRPPAAPVLLVPVELELRGREEQIAYLRTTGDIQLNEVLRNVLEQGFGIAGALDHLVGEGGEEAVSFDPQPIYARLQEHAAEVRGFSIAHRLVLGNFSFQKLAMLKDLRDSALAMYHHDVIAAIAGDPRARERLRAARKAIDPRELDRVPPQQEFLLLDADSSQQRVIASVLDGQTGVIQGPPGTGKSQTISNLIAAAAVRGKRVLFVAEKRAALEVVLRRLQAAGLGHLALDLHGADISRRHLAESLAASLELVRETPPVDTLALDTDFADRRERLNVHATRLHTSRAPSGLSMYELQGRLLRLPPEAVAASRWYGGELSRLSPDTIRTIRELLIESGSFVDLFRRRSASLWNGALLRDPQQVERALQLINTLLSDTFPQLRAALDCVAHIGLRVPSSLAEADTLTTLLEQISGTLALYNGGLFSQNLAALKRKLEPAQPGGVGAAVAWLFNGDHRSTERATLALRHAGFVWGNQMYLEIAAAAEQQERWHETRDERAAPVPEQSEVNSVRTALAEAANKLRAELGELAAMLGKPGLAEMSLPAIEQLLRSLSEDTLTAYRVARLNAIEQLIADYGARNLLDELRSGTAPAEHWPLKLEYAYLSSCLQNIRSQEPALASFDGRLHTQYVGEFCRADRQRIKIASHRVRRLHGERVIEVMNRYPEQTDLVRREAEKRRRHLPLRRLLDLAPDVLTTLCPCWMASPLSVSQLIDAKRYFDMVIFDEASQVLPEDAIAALLRANQVVVAGDRHQLPPTTFFAAGEDENEEAAEELGATEGFESLLDLMASFTEPWSLDWHYRSRDESLIAFSNRHIYGSRLVTFPGTGKTSVISHVLTPCEAGQDGQEESSSAEVRRVVELVLEHAAARPHETLGVITMGIRHADRLQAALDEALRQRPNLDEFFGEQREERFFIKNLERVQGDERDAIILSVGYGKDRSGRLPYRFGPLLREGGERRLNVAVTRARRRLTLVSSFDHNDMDPARSRARGVELLRLYLQYAATRGANLGDSGLSDVPLNSFEADIYDTLTARGIRLLPQWGVSKYRIDMVALHPEKPGRFVLAVECDGATYHSAQTARDRDRLRQQHLEGLGWRFYRIWSTDWFNHREQEIDRAIAAYQLAVQQADQEDATPQQPTERKCVSRVTEPLAEPEQVSPEPVQERGPRPPVPWGGNIEHYYDSQLFELLDWVRSDGRLRTDEELIVALVRELGFKRRGVRIDARLRLILDQDRKRRKKP